MDINLGAGTTGLYTMEPATFDGVSSKESEESDCEYASHIIKFCMKLDLGKQ